jgi:6-phosphogluconolactonase (cycloisomerase 2 family)
VWVTTNPVFNFAYVVSLPDSTLGAFSIGSDGQLTPVNGSPYPTGAFPFAAAVGFKGEFAYVANSTGNSISAFQIAHNGMLTPVVGSPFASGTSPRDVAISQKYPFVFVANSADNTVSMYQKADNGSLTPVAGSPFATGFLPFSLALDRTSQFLYVVNGYSNTISAFRVERSGSLTALRGSPFPIGAGSIATDPLGPFLYVLNGNNAVSGYKIGSDGALTSVTGSPFPTGNAPVSITITPSAHPKWAKQAWSGGIAAACSAEYSEIWTEFKQRGLWKKKCWSLRRSRLKTGSRIQRVRIGSEWKYRMAVWRAKVKTAKQHKLATETALRWTLSSSGEGTFV